MGNCPGGCFENNNLAYRGYIPGNIQVLSHGDCAGVTIDLLNMYKRLIDCAVTHSLYTQIDVSQADINNAKLLLTAWITAKELDPASCEHQTQLPIVQFIINKIVAYGQC